MKLTEIIMHYCSTGNSSYKASFKEAVREGISPDGGLFMPVDIPSVPSAFFRNMPEMSLSDMAYVVLSTLIGNEIPPEQIKKTISSVLTYPVPVCRLEDSNLFATELFHGPTGSSKDMGVRFMVKFFDLLLPHMKDKPVTVIASVSSDNGVAIADAFSQSDNFKVLVVFPKGKISQEAREKIQKLGRNTIPVEVRGSLDDCLAMIRTTLVDESLRGKIKLVSANSINIARLLPTVIQYFYMWAKMVQNGANADSIVISVPCANLANLSAALIAVQMGLPIKRIIAASTNPAITDFLNTGTFIPAQVAESLAPALDIATPMNIARVHGLMKSSKIAVDAVTVTNEDIVSTRQLLSDKYSYTADNHTCVSASALINRISQSEYGTFIATIDPKKRAVQLPQHHRHDSIAPTYRAFRRIIDPEFNY